MGMKKAVVSLSGGMDSATVLAWLLYNNYEVHAISFYYGSKHNPYELEMASRMCSHLQMKAGDYPGHLASYKTIQMDEVFDLFDSNLLTSGGEIPEGHYTDKSMELTVVPGRNMIFLSILAGYAWSVGAECVALGIHQGDHAIYADCRQEFFKAADAMVYLGTDRRVELMAPFIGADKQGILEWGFRHNVPYDITRTCYKPQETACGKCGSCVERLEAFELCGVEDPAIYEKSPT